MLLRRLAQIGSTVLYNANIISDIPSKYIGSSLCVPGMNCMYCPAAVTGCPLGMAQRIFSGGLKSIPLGVIACLLLFGLLFGRLVCGWLCPFGLLQDLLDKAPLPKIKKNRWSQRLSYLKYVIGIVFVIALPLLYFYTGNKQVHAFCQNLCPVNALTMELFTISYGSFSLSTLLHGGGLVLLLVLFSGLFIFRPYCRFLCPLGAFYGLFHRYALFSVKLDESKCRHCGACMRVCPMDCQKVGDRECISCGACANACKFDAIRLCGTFAKNGRYQAEVS